MSAALCVRVLCTTAPGECYKRVVDPLLKQCVSKVRCGITGTDFCFYVCVIGTNCTCFDMLAPPPPSSVLHPNPLLYPYRTPPLSLCLPWSCTRLTDGRVRECVCLCVCVCVIVCACVRVCLEKNYS
jgi:hypothetical protein